MHAEVARTSPELLQKISLPAGEYSLAKRGDDEIEWGGKMYDIASIQFKNGNVEVMALVDEAETNLVALMAKITQAVSSDTKTPPTTLMQYLSLTFTAPVPVENLSSPTAQTIVHRTAYNESDSEAHHLIALPPPRII